MTAPLGSTVFRFEGQGLSLPQWLAQESQQLRYWSPLALPLRERKSTRPGASQPGLPQPHLVSRQRQPSPVPKQPQAERAMS